MFNIDKNKLTLDKKGNIRPDFLLSYWIITWFIAYYFLDTSTPIGKFIKSNANPKLAVILAFLENLVTFIYLIFMNSDTLILVRYIIMMIVIKIYPIYLLRNDPIKFPNDVFLFIAVFIIYNIYLYFWETDIIKVYTKTFISIHENKNETPLFKLFNWLHM